MGQSESDYCPSPPLESSVMMGVVVVMIMIVTVVVVVVALKLEVSSFSYF